MANDPSMHDGAHDLKWLDGLCDEFESVWQSGEEPSLSEFLARVSDAQRGTALRELLALDIEYCHDLGRNAEAADYHQKFPDFVNEIKEVFDAQARKTTDHRDISQEGTSKVASPVRRRLQCD